MLEKRLPAADWDGVARFIALIAQAESGDYESYSPPHNIYMQASSISPSEDSQKPPDLLQKIITSHKRLRGMKPSAAEYWLLKEISQLETFGEELFGCKSVNNTTLGVGPHGITIYTKDQPKQLISFNNIISASSHKRTFKLEYFTVDNKETVLEVKLDSSHVASSLYRALTEKHAFYSCETVRSAVTTQFIRDLKGTIVSIFNEDSTLGKKYVFDIRRTCREVYDNARRALYQNGLQSPKIDKPGCLDHGNECKVCIYFFIQMFYVFVGFYLFSVSKHLIVPVELVYIYEWITKLATKLEILQEKLFNKKNSFPKLLLNIHFVLISIQLS